MVLVQTRVHRVRAIHRDTYRYGLGVLLELDGVLVTADKEEQPMRTKSSYLSPKTLLACLAVLALALLTAWYLSRDDSPTASSAEAPVVVLSAPAAALPALAELEAAERAGSVADLRARLARGPAVVVIEQDTASSIEPGELSFVFDSGSALLGLNVPIDRLNEIAGFENVIGAINPKFNEGGGAKPASFSGEFFSIVWATAPGQEPAYWGRAQNDLKPSVFSAMLSDYRLRVVGLLRDDGKIVPIEEYGRGGGEE
jgi:hypothetical protein